MWTLCSSWPRRSSWKRRLANHGHCSRTQRRMRALEPACSGYAEESCLTGRWPAFWTSGRPDGWRNAGDRGGYLMIKNDAELKVMRERVAALEQLLQTLRPTARPEEW